jgi:hypothetical protein
MATVLEGYITEKQPSAVRVLWTKELGANNTDK